jgi:hypothetical protein
LYKDKQFSGKTLGIRMHFRIHTSLSTHLLAKYFSHTRLNSLIRKQCLLIKEIPSAIIQGVTLSCDALSVTLSLPKCLSKGRRVIALSKRDYIRKGDFFTNELFLFEIVINFAIQLLVERFD